MLKEDLTSQGGSRRRSKASSPVSPPLRWWCLIIPPKFTFAKLAVQASRQKWFNLFPLLVHWHRSALIKLVLKMDNKVGSLFTWPRSPSHRHLLKQSTMGLPWICLAIISTFVGNLYDQKTTIHILKSSKSGLPSPLFLSHSLPGHQCERQERPPGKMFDGTSHCNQQSIQPEWCHPHFLDGQRSWLPARLPVDRPRSSWGLVGKWSQRWSNTQGPPSRSPSIN